MKWLWVILDTTFSENQTRPLNFTRICISFYNKIFWYTFFFLNLLKISSKVDVCTQLFFVRKQYNGDPDSHAKIHLTSKVLDQIFLYFMIKYLSRDRLTSLQLSFLYCDTFWEKHLAATSPKWSIGLISTERKIFFASVRPLIRRGSWK